MWPPSGCAARAAAAVLEGIGWSGALQDAEEAHAGEEGGSAAAAPAKKVKRKRKPTDSGSGAHVEASVGGDGMVLTPIAGVAGASPVPVQMWQRRAQSRCRCGRGERSPGADVAGASSVPVQMWQGWAQSRCRCGSGEPSPGRRCGRGRAKSRPQMRPGASAVPVQMWQGAAQSRHRCGRGERSLGPAMWQARPGRGLAPYIALVWMRRRRRDASRRAAAAAHGRRRGGRRRLRRRSAAISLQRLRRRPRRLRGCDDRLGLGLGGGGDVAASPRPAAAGQRRSAGGGRGEGKGLQRRLGLAAVRHTLPPSMRPPRSPASTAFVRSARICPGWMRASPRARAGTRCFRPPSR